MRGGGDWRLHSPTAWVQPGYKPGAGGAALLPSSKKGALLALGILDRRRDPMAAAERRVGLAAGAQQHTLAIMARTNRSRRALRSRRTRHDHGMQASVRAHTADIACALQPRRAHFGHSARYGHCMDVSVAARTAQHGRRCGQGGPSGPGSATDAGRAAELTAKRLQAGQQGS